MNTLIVVADAAQARLYRVARTANPSQPSELIAVDAIQRDVTGRADSDTPAPREFAERIARRVAQFALHHVCNPLLVAAPPGTSERLLAELELRLPQTYIHSIVSDWTALGPSELLHGVQRALARPEPGHAPVP